MGQAPLLPITDILNGKTNKEIRMVVLFDNSALSYILTLICLLQPTIPKHMRCVALPLMALLILFALLLDSAPVKLILFYCSARKSKFLPKPMPHLGLRMVFMAHRSGEDERRQSLLC